MTEKTSTQLSSFLELTTTNIFSSGSGAMTTDSTGSATPPHMDEEGELLAGGSGRNYAAYSGPKKMC